MNYIVDRRPLKRPKQPRTSVQQPPLAKLFNNVLLFDSYGDMVPWGNLLDKSVGLYFAALNNQLCKNLLPFLINFYFTTNVAETKIEIIFISLDINKEDYDEHRAKMPWLALSYADPAIQLLQKYYKVVPRDFELKQASDACVATIPRLLVIRRDAGLLQDLRSELRRWDFRLNKF